MNKKLFVIFLVVFIDLLGFGIIIPLLPLFSQNTLHVSETYIGLVTGIFSLMQFIFSPFWGRLSDIYGRKPIIIFSLFGNVCSYILLGLVFNGTLQSPELLLFARAMAGFFSANIGAAMAYIADVTPPHERSKGMGLIGAAFGLGFIFGPFMGGILANRFDYSTPVFLSAGLSLLALVCTIFLLNESLTAELKAKAKQKISRFNWHKIKEVLFHPQIGFLILLYFIAVFAISNIFSTFQLFAESTNGFSYDVEQVSYLFAYSGTIGALTQGVFIRQLLKKFNERKIFIAGNFLMGIGLGTIPFANHELPFLLASIFCMSAGNGLILPIGLSLISKFVKPQEQGEVLGMNQSLASLARFIGPFWGGIVYQHLGFMFPFLTGGFVMAIGTVMSLRLMKISFNPHHSN